MWKLSKDSIFDPATKALYKRKTYDNNEGCSVESRHLLVVGPAAETLWLHLCAACEHASSPIELELVKALETIAKKVNRWVAGGNPSWLELGDVAMAALQARDLALGLQAEAEQTAKALLKIKQEESEE